MSITPNPIVPPTPPIGPPRLALRKDDAAAALGISPSQLEILGRKHLIPRVNLGDACVVYPVDALRRFLTEKGMEWIRQQTGDSRDGRQS